MFGEFGEVTVIIGLVINFLAFVSPLLSFRDTLSYELLQKQQISIVISLVKEANVNKDLLFCILHNVYFNSLHSYLSMPTEKLESKHIKLFKSCDCVCIIWTYTVHVKPAI